MTQQYSRAVLMADGLSNRVRFKFQKEFLNFNFQHQESNQHTDQMTVVMDGKGTLPLVAGFKKEREMG